MLPKWIEEDSKLHEDFKKIYHAHWNTLWGKEKVYLSDQEKKLSIHIFKLMFGDELLGDMLKGMTDGDDRFVYLETSAAEYQRVHQNNDSRQGISNSWKSLSSISILLSRLACKIKYPGNHRFNQKHPAIVLREADDIHTLDDDLTSIKDNYFNPDTVSMKILKGRALPAFTSSDDEISWG